MSHPALSGSTNPKLAVVDELFALLDSRPDLWLAVSQLARSKSFFLTDSLEDRVRMALEVIESQLGASDEVARIRRATASLARS